MVKENIPTCGPLPEDSITNAVNAHSHCIKLGKEVVKRPPSKFDELIFHRDLHEVHLLIDFISGRPDHSLSDLKLDRGERRLSSNEIVKAVSLMRYPPSGSDVVIAENAALLLEVKDELNRFVSPARGLTIAYTTMFAGGMMDRRHGRAYHLLEDLSEPASPDKVDHIAPVDNSVTDQPKSSDSVTGRLSAQMQRFFTGRKTERRGHDARLNLAASAFPGYAGHALFFRTVRKWLMGLGGLWLFLTVVAYWDVTFSRSIVERLDQFWKERATFFRADPTLSDPTKCPVYEPQKNEKGARVKQLIPPFQKAEFAGNKPSPGCFNLWYLDQSRDEARQDLTRAFRCDHHFFTIPTHLWCWTWPLAGSIEKSDDSNVVNWQSAASKLLIFTTYVLPVMFGLLGTLIAIFRDIHDKVISYQLAPRDLALLWLTLAFGAVAGVVVGVFFGPTTTPLRGDVASNITLTPSGLSFLAGYASQAFFAFLDRIIKQVFLQESQGTKVNIGNSQRQTGDAATPAKTN